MKIVALIFLGLFFVSNAFAQADQTGKDQTVAVQEISLARDDGSGGIGETTAKFFTDDIPIHCVIQLDSTKTATVKMILVAVKAIGLKPETKSVSVSYTTDGNQDQVNFHASPDRVWAAGTYRADVFINGRLARSAAFEIVKSPKEIADEKLAAPKNFDARKAQKKTRRN